MICRDEQPYECTTRKYVDAFMARCGCLPLNVRLLVKFQYAFCIPCCWGTSLSKSVAGSDSNSL